MLERLDPVVGTAISPEQPSEIANRANMGATVIRAFRRVISIARPTSSVANEHGLTQQCNCFSGHTARLGKHYVSIDRVGLCFERLPGEIGGVGIFAHVHLVPGIVDHLL